MSKLEKLQSYLPPIYDDVVQIQKLLETEAIEYEELDTNISVVEDDFFIETAKNTGLTRVEKIFNITVPIGATEEERRSVIKSVIRGIDKLSATVIKNISLAYQNGEVDVTFVPSNIVIKFISVVGVPTNIEELKNYLNKRKPAHLGVVYVIRYITIANVQTMTIEEIQNTKLDQFSPFI
ncbi:MAG: DUF2313 domain-containing protein [Clostridia bacterium]|nr:DUF2313 domain-containing protein [Clostridia bacterium]MDD4027310.1 DUF2313 domain-containing protein [Candidatus Shapirobacteria bacterium]